MEESGCLSLCLPPAFSLSVCGASPADGCSQVTAGMAGAEKPGLQESFYSVSKGMKEAPAILGSGVSRTVSQGFRSACSPQAKLNCRGWRPLQPLGGAGCRVSPVSEQLSTRPCLCRCLLGLRPSFSPLLQASVFSCRPISVSSYLPSLH